MWYERLDFSAVEPEEGPFAVRAQGEAGGCA